MALRAGPGGGARGSRGFFPAGSRVGGCRRLRLRQRRERLCRLRPGQRRERLRRSRLFGLLLGAPARRLRGWRLLLSRGARLRAAAWKR